MHVHDLNNYYDTPVPGGHTFTHEIHHLRFGPQLPDELTEKYGTQSMSWTNHHLNPLDGTKQATDESTFNYMYFVKVVSTSYLPLNSQNKNFLSGMTDSHSDLIPIGAHGFGEDGSLETHQYSVTSHKRSLAGGSDAKEGHKERVHAKGGIPGVFFSYVSHATELPLRI